MGFIELKLGDAQRFRNHAVAFLLPNRDGKL